MALEPALPPLEVWGGLECTVARVGETWRDQLAETGHSSRPQDLDAIAALGIRTLRYPVLWESVAPDHPDHCDWRWHDERLQRLHALGIRVVAGLLHHGSGPRYTNLLDPQLPELLARHAANAARRYPWITAWTPVNEPLTTARFSALYGHWYPHRSDTGSMVRALALQCRGVLLSMRAVRAIVPKAQLVQTEDLGKVFSTPILQYQADYENQRRWLSFDLLAGRVDAHHPWYHAFLAAGVSADELALLAEGEGMPDLFGINHYTTSDRFLDQQPEHYPLEIRRGQAGLPYVDVQAVRVAEAAAQTGFEARLREAWERYRRPLAITEVHHGGARDEQLRWLLEAWQAAHTLRAEGADLRAFTIWSLFGCVDWNSLLLQREGSYESGLFDARCSPPRPTLLASAAAALVRDAAFDHPVLAQPGWWRRPGRFLHAGGGSAAAPLRHAQPLAVTGASGTLGRAFARVCGQRGIAYDLLSRHDMDIADPAKVAEVLAQRKPWALVNAAGFVRVADAGREAQRCHRENARGAEVLAQACAQLGIPYLTFSSDLVFDGQLGRPYLESDNVSPACEYGHSKADAERRVAQSGARALVIRSSAFFGPWDNANFLQVVLRLLAQGEPVRASARRLVSPTYVPDLAHAALDLLLDGEHGIWHLANRGVISWHGLALQAARAAGLDSALLRADEEGAQGLTALASERGLILPSLDNAIERFVTECKVDWRAAGNAAGSAAGSAASSAANNAANIVA